MNKNKFTKTIIIVTCLLALITIQLQAIVIEIPISIPIRTLAEIHIKEPVLLTGGSRITHNNLLAVFFTYTTMINGAEGIPIVMTNNAKQFTKDRYMFSSAPNPMLLKIPCKDHVVDIPGKAAINIKYTVISYDNPNTLRLEHTLNTAIFIDYRRNKIIYDTQPRQEEGSSAMIGLYCNLTLSAEGNIEITPVMTLTY